jgi:hypothetical protein
VQQIEETHRFILNNFFDRMQISIFTPYPGSEEFDKIMNKENPDIYLKKIKEYLYQEKIDSFLKFVDIETLYKKSRETYMKFYFSPRVLLSILLSINLQQIKDILNHPIFKSFFKKKHDIKDTYVNLKS